jgi:hypothetical protein
MGASRLVEPGTPSRELGDLLITGKRGLELKDLAPAIPRKRVSSLVAQESILPAEGLAAHTIRLVVLVLGFMVAPEVVLTSKAEATEVTLNVDWGVNENTLCIGHIS